MGETKEIKFSKSQSLKMSRHYYQFYNYRRYTRESQKTEVFKNLNKLYRQLETQITRNLNRKKKESLTNSGESSIQTELSKNPKQTAQKRLKPQKSYMLTLFLKCA